jgi:hypothetical protein
MELSGHWGARRSAFYSPLFWKLCRAHDPKNRPPLYRFSNVGMLYGRSASELSRADLPEKELTHALSTRWRTS